MLKKRITYKDYNDVERTEDFYFNLNEAELVDMETTEYGGLADRIRRIVDSKDMPSIMKEFKDIIKKAYGEKTPDGKYLDKSEAISNRFMNSEAYNVLFMELLSDADYAAKFISEILPPKYSTNNNPPVIAPAAK